MIIIITRGKIFGPKPPKNHAGHEVVGEAQKGSQGRITGLDVEL